jgi:hypothetical protein
MRKDEGKQLRPQEKVTGLVRAVDNSTDSGFNVSRFQSFKGEGVFAIRNPQIIETLKL